MNIRNAASKTLTCLIAAAFVYLLTPSAVHAAEFGPWQTLAKLVNGQGETIAVLSYRTKHATKLSSAKGQWRVENRSDRTFYNVGIGNKTYTLSNGQTKKSSGESCGKGFYNKIESGDTSTTIPDTLGGEQGTRVTRVSVDRPLVKFSLKPKASRQAWSEYGTVRQ